MRYIFRNDRMQRNNSIQYLAPRFIGTLLVLLIFSLMLEFSADNFDAQKFFIASIPGIILFLLLILAWYREGIGGGIFIVLGIGGILYPFATSQIFHLGFMILPGLSILVGSLFLVSKIKL